MFDLAEPAWTVVVRTAAVYLAVFIGLRLMGKREMGQMTVFDLVVVLLISSAVQNAMVGRDTSLLGGIVAAFVLLIANRGVGYLRLRGGRWGRMLEGTPTVLVEDGEFVESHLRREGLDRTEVEMAIREHGLDSVGAVKLAVLETDGAVSIVPMTSRVMRGHRHVRQIRKK